MGKIWNRLLFCVALTGAWPYPMPEQEARRIEHYLHWLLENGAHTRQAVDSATTHFSILQRDIALLKARGVPAEHLQKIESLAQEVSLMIQTPHTD